MKWLPVNVLRIIRERMRVVMKTVLFEFFLQRHFVLKLMNNIQAAFSEHIRFLVLKQKYNFHSAEICDVKRGFDLQCSKRFHGRIITNFCCRTYRSVWFSKKWLFLLILNEYFCSEVSLLMIIFRNRKATTSINFVLHLFFQ